MKNITKTLTARFTKALNIVAPMEIIVEYCQWADIKNWEITIDSGGVSFPDGFIDNLKKAIADIEPDAPGVFDINWDRCENEIREGGSVSFEFEKDRGDGVVDLVVARRSKSSNDFGFGAFAGLAICAAIVIAILI